MIYLPMIEIKYEYTPMEQIYDVVTKTIVDRKAELEYDDRIDAILLMLDHMGYTWAEYAEERKQKQYYLDMKREQIKNGTKTKSTLS